MISIILTLLTEEDILHKVCKNQAEPKIIKVSSMKYLCLIEHRYNEQEKMTEKTNEEEEDPKYEVRKNNVPLSLNIIINIIIINNIYIYI